MREKLVRAGPFLGLALVVLFFALASGAPDRYLSANNLRVVLAQTVIVALGAVGMTLVIVGGGIDLAVGSTIALTGVLCALAIRDGWAPIVGVLVSVLAGGAIGLLNGLAITRATRSSPSKRRRATVQMWYSSSSGMICSCAAI